MRRRLAAFLVIGLLVGWAGYRSLGQQSQYSRFDREFGQVLKEFGDGFREAKGDAAKTAAVVAKLPDFKRRAEAIPEPPSEYRRDLRKDFIAFNDAVDAFVKKNGVAKLTPDLFTAIEERVMKMTGTLRKGPEPGSDEHDH